MKAAKSSIFLAIFFLLFTSTFTLLIAQENENRLQPFDKRILESFVVPAGKLNLEIHHIDVGTGCSTLVKTPNGLNILIDGGAKGAGNKYVLPYLKKEGVSTIHMMIASYPEPKNDDKKSDDYSIAGLVDVLTSNIEVVTVVIATQSPDSYSDYFMSAAWVYPTEGVFYMELGTEFDLGSNAKMTCIAVDRKVLGGGQMNKGDFDRSICLLINHDNFSYFTGGGATHYSESALQNAIGDVDVMRAIEPSNYFAEGSLFLKITRPEVVVISPDAPGKNWDKVPANTVISRIKESGATIYQTNKGSNNQVKYDDQHILAGDVVILGGKGKKFTVNKKKHLVDEKLPGADKSPTAKFTFTKDDRDYRMIHFNGEESSDDKKITKWYWNFGGDGEITGRNKKRVSYRFSKSKKYGVSLTVYDASGNLGKHGAEVDIYQWRSDADTPLLGVDPMEYYDVRVEVWDYKGNPVSGAHVKGAIEYNIWSDYASGTTDEHGIATLRVQAETYVTGYYFGDLTITKAGYEELEDVWAIYVR